MRTLIFVLFAMLIASEVGCTSTPKKEPRTLQEWGALSRPKF